MPLTLPQLERHLFKAAVQSRRHGGFIHEIRSCPSIGKIQWNNYPPMMGSEWITVKVSGVYDSISPLIPGLKADSYYYRDLSKSGGNRSWDRSYRVTTLDPRFLDDSPWMIFTKSSAISNGVAVDIHNGADQRVAHLRVLDGILTTTKVLISRLMELHSYAAQVRLLRPSRRTQRTNRHFVKAKC